MMLKLCTLGVNLCNLAKIPLHSIKQQIKFIRVGSTDPYFYHREPSEIRASISSIRACTSRGLISFVSTAILWTASLV